MPLVSLPLAQLRGLVGPETGREELLGAIEQLGCDVEGRSVVTSYRCGRCGSITEALEHEDFNGRCAYCGSEEVVVTGSAEVIRINLLPVRPDMFDAAGLARAVRGYLSFETGLPLYRLESSGLAVAVRPGLEDVRPHIVACVVRGLAMDDETLKMLMKMQENLHWALGRDRRRASIGVYDLATVTPDFEYRPVEPEGVRFIPLFGMPDTAGQPEMREATPEEILERHPKGVGYKHLLAGSKRYPLLSDARGQVLSLPPIINSEATRVTPATKDLFIDVTGPDRNAIARTIAVIACSLADLGARVETVEVQYPDGRKETTPALEPATMAVSADNVRRVLGIEIPRAELPALLERMRYGVQGVEDPRGQVPDSNPAAPATPESCNPATRKSVRPATPEPCSAATPEPCNAATQRPVCPVTLEPCNAVTPLAVSVPAFRADVMHEYDVIEDIGIAYGYHRMKTRLVPSMTVSRALASEERSETARRLMAGLGFLETMTLMLTNEREHFAMLRLGAPETVCAIDNPASVEQTMVRAHLLSGLLATLRENTTREMPQYIFEVGDCCEPAPSAETGVRTVRKLAAAVAGPRAGFADARAVTDALAREFDLVVRYADSGHPCFIPGRAADVFCRKNGREIAWGVLGEVHPEVLVAWGISQPVALLELGVAALI